MISLPYFSCRHTQKAVASVPHKKSLGLIVLTCLGFEEPPRCAALVFNVSPLEAAYSCLPLLLGKTSSPSGWILPKPSQPGLFSSPLALCNFKHACAHTRNLSAATASPWGDTFGTVLFPHVKDMWSWKMAKNPTEMAGGGQVLIQMSHHSLIPSVTHIIWLMEQHSVMDLKTVNANASISMTESHLRMSIFV